MCGSKEYWNILRNNSPIERLVNKMTKIQNILFWQNAMQCYISTLRSMCTCSRKKSFIYFIYSVHTCVDLHIYEHIQTYKGTHIYDDDY